MEQKSRASISSFYDEYASQQKKVGINLRHLTIFNNLKKIGLSSDSKVLEIGCGIGTFTHFLSTKVNSGKIVAVDISPKSVEIAKNTYAGKKNIEFVVSDMSDFGRTEKFDFVVLPDVLEHIPLEQHHNLFKNIAKLLHNNSSILINIPNPRALEWIRKNKPELLQIIDQPLHTNLIINSIYENGFYIESLNSYSLFYNNLDYQSIILRPNQEIKNMKFKSDFIFKFKSFLVKHFQI